VAEIPIYFFKEDVRFRLNHSDELKKWIHSAIRKHKFTARAIHYIFSSDKYLLKLNKEFLHHNYFTDIITFNNSTEKKNLEADIYISIDRVHANAEKFNMTFRDELHRVMIHGALHLVGFDDKKKSMQAEMRKEEDRWLEKRNF
jgi:probable rRNA maturation factor